MPADETWRHGISMSSLQAQLEDTQVRQIFYAADACYSGLGLPSSTRAGEEQSLPAHWKDAAAGNRYVSLSAGGAGQTAYDRFEGERMGGPHGLFTYFLLNGLDGSGRRCRRVDHRCGVVRPCEQSGARRGRAPEPQAESPGGV